MTATYKLQYIQFKKNSLLKFRNVASLCSNFVSAILIWYAICSKTKAVKLSYLPRGGSKGGSGGSVETPELNVKTYNKRVLKNSEPTQLINISFENDMI